MIPNAETEFYFTFREFLVGIICFIIGASGRWFLKFLIRIIIGKED